VKKISKTNKKLNIVMLGQKRIPSREGGIEIVVEELSTRMVALGYMVTCLNRSRGHISEKEFKGIKLKKVLTYNKRGLAAVTASISGAIVATFGKYNVVHFHAEGICAMLWLPKLFGKKCIATIHGLDHQRAKWGKFASKYIMMGEKCAVKYADEIIVLSESIQKYFQETYGRETKFISNGVNKPKIREGKLIKERFGLDTDDYILFLGRLVPEKGIPYLLEAFQKVKTDRKLVIAGGASDTNQFVLELKEAARGDNRIVFTGFVQGQILDELYSNAYIYVLPSDLEGMPIGLLEAMSYGNCCVVSDISECTDVVEDKAIIFKRGDVIDLQKKLQKLCNEKKLVKEYQDSSADFICNKYAWDRVVEETVQIYGGNDEKDS
jgi:Glycosyltransferase